MRLTRIIVHRLGSLLRPSRAEAEMKRELDIHIEQLTREYMADGLDEAEARLRARREFGPVGSIEEHCRDMRRVTVVDDLRKDLTYAFRLLAKSPGFTLTAVLSLVLGIGATVAIFSLVDVVLLRSLPVSNPGQLVEVSRVGGGPLSYPMYERIRKADSVFSGSFAVMSGPMGASVRIHGKDAGDVDYSPVSGDYFAVLGLTPAIGRTLTEDDLGPSNTAVISHQFWQRTLQGDAAVLGTAMRLGRSTVTIVGVGPPGFRGIAAGQPVDVWVPLTWFGPLTNPEALMVQVIGRRKADVSEAQARAGMDLVGRQWDEEWKFEWKARLDTEPASGGLNLLRRRFSRPLLVLMSVVSLLLLIASVNVANLLLARASARQREIAVRLSLGADRARLIRQLLTESVVLGGIAAVFGTLLAPPTAAFLVRFLASAVGTLDLSFGVDGRILTFALLVMIGVVLLFGLAPALTATRLDLAGMFKGGGTASDRNVRGARTGRLLVMAQVAICCLLLTGAVLFARSLQTLNRVDAGFRPENVMLMHVEAGGNLTPVERVRLYDRVRDRLAGVPGVRSAALSSGRLFGGTAWTEPLRVPGFVPARGQSREALLFVVSPSFFQTMDTPILNGRDLDSRDDERGAPVAIVNEAAARYFFGGADPVGRTFHVEHRGFSRPLTIVGLVRDQKYRSLKESTPSIVYLPYLQMPGAPDEANLVLRTTGSAERITDVLLKTVKAESAALRISAPTTQARLIQGTIAQDRMLAQLSACFGFAAVILVCLGLYGVTAYDMSRRTAEIALRIALGGQPWSVIRAVVGGSLLHVAIGIAIGLGAAIGLARFVESLLFGVKVTDIPTMTLSAAMILSVAAAAAYWPARRAVTADPLAALKRE